MEKRFLLFVSLLLVFSLSGCSVKEAPQDAPVSKQYVEFSEYEFFEFSNEIAEAFSKCVWKKDHSMLDQLGYELGEKYIEADDAYYYYDYTDNGNALFFCKIFDSYGMSQYDVEIAVTHDYGRTWEDLGSYHAADGDYDLAIMNDGDICIAMTSPIDCMTYFLLSDNGGLSFYELYADELMPEVREEILDCGDIEILCTDSDTKSVVITWRYKGNSYLITEFNDGFKTHKILYRNDNLSEYVMEGVG